MPTLTASAPAVLGTTVEIQVGNASGVSTYGCLFVGHTPAAIATPYGGTLLLVPTATASLHPLPAGGATIPWKIPLDVTWCGMYAYAQLAHDDVTATHGIAFSRGLHVVVGQ